MKVKAINKIHKLEWCLFLCSTMMASVNIHSQNGIPKIIIIPNIVFILIVSLSPQMVFLVAYLSFFGYQDAIME